MKKIGILFGMEKTFPSAVIDRINEKGIEGIVAEKVEIDIVKQAEPTGYAVIIDRISQDVPFYRAYLKNAALSGTTVVNNPFWWSADEKFFNSALMEKVGVPVPKTVILPSHHRPDDTSEESFRNLKFPTDWEGIFDYIGFPAYMKPHDGGGWKNVYRVENAKDLFEKHGETGQQVMMLQEEILFDHYFRCYCLGQKDVLIMPYEPRNPHHLRYVVENPCTDNALLTQVEELAIQVNRALGYDFNTVEFAVRDGIPYAIDFCNPAPDADLFSVGQENFDWIVEHAAEFAIEKALENDPSQQNLSWGSFVSEQFTEAISASGRVTGTKRVVKRVVSSAGTSKKAAKKGAKATKKNASKVTVKSGKKSSNAKAAPKSKATPKSKSASKVAAKTAAKSKKAVKVAPKAKAKKVGADKLTKIEGIGPKIASLLQADGITTFKKLSKASNKKLQGILDAAGSRYRMHNPTTWAQQAELASSGDWKKLEKLQAKLNGGRKK